MDVNPSLTPQTGTGPPGPAPRRSLLLGRLASPTTAGGIGVLSLVLLFASIPLEFLIPQGFSLDAAQAVAWFVFGLLSTSVGVVVLSLIHI